MTRTGGSQSRRQRGQALAETGIVILMLVTLGMGIVEFGRMLLVVHMITNATRDAARAAATMGGVNRCETGDLASEGKSAICAMVQDQVADVGLTVACGDGVSDSCAPPDDPGGDGVIAVSQELNDDGIPIVTVSTCINVPYMVLFWIVGDGLPVGKAITFRDEIGTGTAACT
jgi:hypothetical protein